MASCPIAGYSVNENVARLVAFWVVVAIALVLVLPLPWARWILLALACDFGLRGLSKPRWSGLSRLSGAILTSLGVRSRLVDAGPKRFAARIGFGFSIVLLAMSWTAGPEAFRMVAGVLGMCALLESSLGLCVGCHLWSAWWALRQRVVA